MLGTSGGGGDHYAVQSADYKDIVIFNEANRVRVHL